MPPMWQLYTHCKHTMLSLANAKCKTSQGSLRPAVQRCAQHAHGTSVVRRINKSRSHCLGSDWTPKDAASIAHAVPSGKDARDERAALLGKRAATIARKLLQQREHAGATPVNSRSPLDESLTSLLTSLLGTLADATATSSHADTTKKATSTNDALLQLLTQWADEFLVSDDASSASTSPKYNTPGSSPSDAASVAKSLFMQLLAELLPSGPASGVAGQVPNAAPAAAGPAEPSVGRGLLAATAAAYTAREAASRLQQRWQDGTSTDTSKETKTVALPSTTDAFDPDAWEAAAKAAAEAAQAPEVPDIITPDIAAAAVASSTSDFSPDAWEVAAAAAAAAATSEDDHEPNHELRGASASSKPPLPEPCWAVKTLAQALQAATAAAALHGPRTAPAQDAKGTVPCVQELLLLPASTAIQQLLQLPAMDRAGLLMLLCGASAAAAEQVAFGSRGDAWLLIVLEGVAPALGLLEMGVLLAAVLDRYGEGVFIKAATTLLPLKDTRDPSLSLVPAAAPPQAAALQALLLHWLLQPQLTAAGLPIVPEVLLLRLLPQVIAANSIRALTQAAHWGSVWPLLQLSEPETGPQASPSSLEGSRATLSNSQWQLAEPQVDAVVQSQAWCGSSGVPVVWLAHVAAAAAAKLVHGTSSSSFSSSSSSAQLSEGAAAAAHDARAVLTALLRGLQPTEPLLLMMMDQVRLLEPQLAGMAASTTAAEPWKQQLQQLLLEAYSGTDLQPASLADCIHRSLRCMWPSSAGKQHSVSIQQQQVLNAAAALLAALPAEQLQQELHTLATLADDHAAAAATQQHSTEYGTGLGSILAATAAAADPAQAAAMLSALPMPFWAEAWAAFVSPVTGSFCWTRNQLAATLLALTPATSASAGRLQLKAAWDVVAAHFNLQAVVEEIATRPAAAAAVSSSSPAQPPQQQLKPFDSAKPYTYTPGVPFVGHGWDQAEDTSTARPGARATCFAGSLGAFVAEVLLSAPLPTAASHVAALVDTLPAQAFARVAAVVVPRLVAALDSLGPGLSGPQAFAPGQPEPWTATSVGESCGPGLLGYGGSQGFASLSKSLFKLYDSFPELPEAPWAMQLVAAAAPHLPLDRLPQLLTAAAALAPQLVQMPWVPGAHGLSSSDESSPELSAVQQLELMVAAAASGRDNMALQHMLAMLVRQLPLKEAHIAFRVLQRLSAAGPYQQLTYAAIEEASSTLRQRCDDAAGTAAASPRSSKGTQTDSEVVWQLGQSDAAADTPPAAHKALSSFIQAWGSSGSSSSSAAGVSSSSSSAASVGNSSCSAAFSSEGSVQDVYEADRGLVRKLSGLVSDVPAAPPQGSWPMDAMHSPSYTAPLLKRCLALLVDWVPSCPSAAAAAAQQINILAHKRQWTAAEASAFLQRLPLATSLQLLLEAGTSSSSSSSSRRDVLVRLRPKLLRALVDWQGSEAVTQGLRELLVGYNQQGLASFAEVVSELKLAFAHRAAATDSSSSGARAPNAYVAAVLEVSGVLLAAGTDAGCSWPNKLAQVLVKVSLQVPEAVSARLVEQVARSFTDTNSKRLSINITAPAAWQADVAAVLAALPSAAAACEGQGRQVWVPVAADVAVAVAESAGSTAALQCIRATLLQANSSAAPAWSAELATVLGRLQQAGVLTCGVAYSSITGVSTGGSSSMEGRFGSRPGPITPACSSLQLQQLLLELYQTHHAINLQQAAAAILAVQPSLGKALPMAAASILGSRALRTARGYGASGPDAVEAAAALESATADVAARYQPTAAALPAATAAAAMQLSEALARAHELLPDAVVAALMAALAAVLPWADDTEAAAAAGPDDGSSSITGATCPAETELEQGGWGGITQALLITSSLLTGSCRVWGVDKGTQVAASLIQKLVTPAVSGGSAAAAGTAVPVGSTDTTRQGVTRSKSSSELQQQPQERPSSSYRRSVSSGFLTGLPQGSSTSTSSSHAARAESALFSATGRGRSRSSSGNSQADLAGAKLAAAAATGGVDQPGSQAGRAAAALRAASSSSHASLAEGKLLQAAVATGGEAIPGSHAGRAKAALLRAAASGLAEKSDSDCGGHAQHAQQALVQALASGVSSEGARNAAAEDASDAELAAWGTEQLLVAADAWLWPGLTLAQELVRAILYPKYYSGAAAATEAASRSAGQLRALAPCDAAAALAAALPRLVSELPSELVAEVLVQTWGLLPSASWSKCVDATAAAAVRGQTGAAAEHVQLLQLLQLTTRGLQQQLEPAKALPAAYAEVLGAAASKLPDGYVQQLLQQLVVGSGAGRDAEADQDSFGLLCLAPEGLAQLLLEVSRPNAVLSSSSSGTGQVDRQLQLVAAVASAVLGHQDSVRSGNSPAALAGALAGRLYQAALVPRTYLTLLLLPHLSTPQTELCVKQLGLNSSGDTPAALAALADLCNTLNPGRQLPLGSYTQVLAAALNLTLSADFSKVSNPEAKLGLELERRQTLQQLLAGVVQVLGTFRGMRRLHTSPLGAQLLLPMHDLAAALCFSWQLLPQAAATGLAEAVAAALERLPGDKPLTTVLQLLPNAAAEGFQKGPEPWRPLLHVMAVAGGMSDAQESDLTRKLLAVSAQQVPSYPLLLEAAGTVAAAGEGVFADPAAVAAALSPAAANNEVGLSAGRTSRSTAAAADGGADAVVEEDADSDLDLSEADAALLTTAAAAYVCAALTGFTPLVVFMGSMSTLLVAALGATQQQQGTSITSRAASTPGTLNKASASTPSSLSSSSTGDADASMPSSPRTPSTTDSVSSTARRATMGGRSKVSFAPAVSDDIKGQQDKAAAAAVLGYGATAAAAAAAAVGQRAGVDGLGSLAVDPDDVIKKIRSQSAQLPLDQALMELVPLLLLPPDSSSYTWPLLGLSAVLHSKFPRINALLGPGGAGLINMALAATLINPDGPLAAVMNSSELMAESSGSSVSSAGPARQQLQAALAAAEAVHPHAVSMQLAERLLNALWAVLSGSVLSTATSSGSSMASVTTTASSAACVSTPEGAAAAWQQVAVQLLKGVDADVAIKLLTGFAHKQQANWEAQLRAIAVAATLQDQDHSSKQLLPKLLAQVCAGNKYPPLSFLSLLVHHTAVQLSGDDTAAVLSTALAQLTANYATDLTALQERGTGPADRGYGSSRGQWGAVGVTGEFDSWGLDALSGVEELFAGQGFAGSNSGPQYRSTSSFSSTSNRDSSSSSSRSFQPRIKLSSVPTSTISLVEALVRGACARGHGAEAVQFMTEVLAVTHNRTRLQQDIAAAGELPSGPVLVVEEDQEQQLLQLAVLAVKCCLDGSQEYEAGPLVKGRSQIASGAPGLAAVKLHAVLPELLQLLADRRHYVCSNEVVSEVCRGLARQYGGRAAARSAGSAAVSPQLVGLVLTTAAEGVRRSEGLLSAAKPVGAVFLTAAAEGLFSEVGLSVPECLVLLGAVAAHLPERLALQVVAAAAGRLHSVMPQAVSIVRQVATKE